ncbi:bifunctional aminodeoxychorismate synthase component I/aminotransferase [Bifidobacterium primatium]|uniref:Bifunctional aminodeoxychorismate synthase component I/aminotransferase n=1 Tax=Bifidobacterium primatium TaxID=2045438 RepID=A0A2M9H8G4_9BIFI|nr:anthranilate synthase component I family protein [Bifidobacterium primatium]PJM73099.1 bifunctional aminodeoxychorismate synthase component I/aminotransferase [Bifidobacterium primatium]
MTNATTMKELRPYRALADMAAVLGSDDAPMVLLDSQEGGRYSILGVNPCRQLLQYGGDVRESRYESGTWARTVHHDSDVMDIIRRWSAEAHGGATGDGADDDASTSTPSGRRDAYPPFVHGVMGFLSYDDGLRRHGLVSRHVRSTAMPDAAWWDFDDILVEDHRARRTTLISHHRRDDAPRIEDLWRSAASEPAGSHDDLAGATWTCDHDRASYVQGIESLRAHMRDGDAYVANYSLRFSVSGPLAPMRLFQRLAINNPAPYAGYVNGGGWQIVSSSPERFLQCRRRHISTEPIKGTRPRSNDPGRDLVNRIELERSDKDHSELLMVTDLERNDLSRVAKPGTVVTPAFAAVHSFAHVHHLISTVEADLAEGRTVEDAIEAMSPGGSITGAPKRRVMQLIDRYERSARGAYTGSLGYIGFDGDADLNILIRSATHIGSAGMNGQGGEYEYLIGAGGGITIDSDPDFEYDEAMQKAEALLDALGCDMKGQWHD